jgi:hypothetical protein
VSIAAAALTARPDAIFEKDTRRAQEIHLDARTRRGSRHELKDNAFYLLNELLYGQRLIQTGSITPMSPSG